MNFIAIWNRIIKKTAPKYILFIKTDVYINKICIFAK